jgi:LysM repeat protein
MNSLQNLINLLNDAITNGGGNLTLPVTDIPESKTLVGYLLVDSIEIVGAKLTSTPTEVTVAGTISVLGLTKVQASLTGQVDDTGANLLQLQIFSFPSGWNFLSSFPNLPQSEDFSTGIYAFKKSFLGDLVLNTPTFIVSTFADSESNIVEGLNFSGQVSVTGPLKQIQHLISAIPLLSLYGGITLQKDNPPLLDLRADLPAFNFNLGQTKMTDVHVTMKTVPPADEDEIMTSEMGIAGTVTVGSVAPITIVISSALQNTGIWVFKGIPVDQSATLANGLADLTALISGSVSDLQLPTVGKVFSAFALSEISVTLSATDSSIKSIFVSVTSTEPWILPLPNFKLEQVSTGWNFLNPLDSSRSVNGYVSGIFVFGQEQVGLQVTANLPKFVLFASLQDLDGDDGDDELPAITSLAIADPPKGIKVSDILITLTGSDGGIKDLTVTQFDLMLDPNNSSYSLATAIEDNWSLTLGQTQLILERMTLSLNYNQTSLSGSIAAYFNIFDTDFTVSAEKPAGNNGWIFSGSMLNGQQLSLQKLATGFLPADYQVTLPAPLDTLALTELSASLNTKDNTYALAAGFTWTLNLIEGSPFEIDASFKLQSSKSATGVVSYSGEVSGEFKVNDLDIKVSYQFQPNNNTLSFALNFRGTTLTCTLTSKKVETPTPHTEKTLTVSIGNLNVGQMIEYLVNLADPKSNFKLTSPWDVLNDISLKNLSLEINLYTNDISVSYTPTEPINLVIIKLTSIKLIYKKKLGQGTVDIELGGDFLGVTYDPKTNPLKWDLMNDQPPATPGAGAALLDLEYLGLGQHIALDTTGLNNVTQVINALEAMLQPVSDPTKNPMTQLKGLSFSQNSNWLIGTKFTVMGTVTLAVIFNDPQVYGLLIALGGTKSGSLAGLQFEILYKKVTDTIGVYHIELKLPDAMRNLEFGQVSITLPIIVIDIYTNGNFRIDFGFPWNGDFSRSFSVQVFPFVGYGGFYFNYLNGDTSTRVPKITNGNFNPVIEFGLGLSLGVGKTINKGVLSAGVSVTVQGILEGVVGWFNPNDSSLPSDRYYWVQGTISIVGKLYGSVDFVIIQVSVSVTAYASATLTIEAFKPILISLSAGVSVSASVKILFIRIHFSFSIQLDLSFTIGQASTPPWIVDQSGSSKNQLPQPRHLFRGARVLKASAALQATDAYDGLNWTATLVLDKVYTSQMFVLPAFTVSVLECGDAPTPLTAPQVQAVMLPFLENSLPVDPTTPKAMRTVARADADVLPFNLIVKAMLGWSIYSLTQNMDTTIKADGLEYIYKQMTAADANQTIFAVEGSTIYQNLSSFIGKNFVFQITGTADASLDKMSATIFPIMPDLVMTAGNNAPVDFSIKTPVDQNYRTALQTYFKDRLANAESNVAQDPLANPNGLPVKAKIQAVTDDKESMATVIFNDYFFMLAKSAVQAARDALTTYKYAVKAGDSLDKIVSNFPADATTAESIAIANQDVTPLNTNTTLTNLGIVYEPGAQPVVKYQIKSGDTLTSIAGKFSSNTGIVAQNATNDSIFQLTATISYPQSSYTVQSGDTLDFIAAYYLVRNLESAVERDLRWFRQLIIDSNNQLDFRTALTAGTTLQIPQLQINPQGIIVLTGSNTPYTVQANDTLQSITATFYSVPQANVIDPYFGWLRQAILALSTQGTNNQNVDFTKVLPAGTVLTIPTVVLTSEGVVQQPDSQAFPYTSRAGDTLDLVAGYFLLTQLEQSQLTAIETNIKNANPGVNFSQLPATINIPLIQHQIAPADSFEILGTLFGTAVDIATPNNQSTTLLSPLAILEIPNVSHKIAEGEKLTTIAATYDFTIQELADMIATTEDIFVPSTSITIPSLGEIGIQELLNYMLANGDFNNMAAMVSRFMLHGMRIPEPPAGGQLKLSIQHFKEGIAEGDGMCPLYELTGQQFAAPQTIPPDTDYDIVFANKGQAAWIEFLPTSSYTVPTEQSLSEIAFTLSVPASQIVALNPGVDFSKPVPQDTVLTVPSNSISIKLTSDTTTHYPSTTFSPDNKPAERLPLLEESPVRYTFSKNLVWQVPDNSLFPNAGSQLAGQPNLWLFPDTLVTKVETQSSPKPFDLKIGSYTNSAVMQLADVQNYFWGTALQLNIRQILSQTTNSTMPGSYLSLGADQTGNDLLRAVYNYLTTSPGLQDSATLYLLYQPNPANANSNGVASDILDRANTFVLKTNLSTETHSGPQLLASEVLLAAPSFVAESGDYYANIAAAKEFLQFLWEGSIVGTGGFYLNYATQGGGLGLPASVFSNGDEATLWLVILLDSQSNPNKLNRALHPFNNCAVVLDNIDTSKSNVFAEMTDKSDLAPYTTVSAGNIGFQLTRPNPEQLPESPEQLTQALYNLLGFDIVGNTLFSDSGEMPPIGPIQDDPDQTGGLPLPAASNTDDSTWRFHQIVPIYKFALTNNISDSVAGLPAYLNNPYAGITKILNDQKQYELGNATFSFAFQDIYGNRTPPDVAINNLPIPVGYFDTIIGLSQWAGTASTYEFTGQNNQPVLNVQIGLDLAKYIASPGNPYTSAVYSASAHQERYKQLYYQVQQKQILDKDQPYDLNFYLSTTMSQASSTVLPRRYPVESRYLLTNFINSAYLFLTTAMWLRTFNHPIAGDDTFAKIAIDYFGANAGNDPATLEAIAIANQNTPAAQFLATPSIQIPNFYVARQGDTLNSIGKANNQTALEIATNNQTAALSAGTILALPKRTEKLVFTEATDNTLAAVAQSELATVAGLSLANETALSLLASGISITYQGITVQTGDTGLESLQTFSDLENYFNKQLAGQNVTVMAPDIAVTNQNVQGIFIPGATLTINDYVVQPGDTIQSVLSKFQIQIADLVTLNEELVNFFEAGASLFISTHDESINNTDTLLTIANVNFITLQQLAFYNRDTALLTGASLVVPNLVTLDAGNGQYSFYQADATETFGEVASLFNQAVLKLATDNADMTGIFTSSQSITLDNITVTTGNYDTFNTLYTAFKNKGLPSTFEEFVNQLQSLPKLIAQGAFFVCALPQLTTASTSIPVTTLSLAQIANDFQAACVAGLGLDTCISNLGLVNSALKGFLQAGVTVYADQAKSISITTNVNDTLVSLVTRFALEKGVTTTVSDLAVINQNETTLVAANAAFILPPISAVLNQNIQGQYPGTIFPVAVKLEMERDADLIDSEFKSSSISTSYEDVSGVELDRSTIAPRTTGAAGQALNLGAFAVDFETKAFPGLKIATGKQLTEGQSQASVPPLWAVDFTASGFSKFDIQNDSANFFAVTPLSTQLISRSNVPISAYNNGVLETAKPLNFQAIDMDVWVRDFLAAVDFFLSPEYAVPAYELDPAHKAFSGVVASKETIADAVKTTVDYILQTSSAPSSSDPALAAAQEALYQQLLINLSNAYAIDSIIQYPVTIASKETNPDTAPRISGKPVSTTYTTEATDTIQSIANQYNVSAVYLAQLLANTPRILNTTATLSYNDQPATMQQISDATKKPLDLITLQVIADYFKTTVDDLAAKLTVTAGGGLFAVNNTINISPIKKAIAGADTFDSLAEYFNQSVNEVAIANQFVTGIFAVTSITINGQTVNVNQTDSLSSAGQKFTPVLSAATLANELATQTGLLTVGIPLYAIQVVPDYTLSTAKVPLLNGGALLTLLFNTKAEAQFKKLFLDLNYVMNELEYDIEPSSDISDYQASSWLSFIIPIDSTVSDLPNVDSKIGQVEVPIPLRSYPTPPSLISQAGEPEFPEASDVEQAKKWTYALTYERQDAAQDTDYLRVTFNASTQNPLLAGSVNNANSEQLFNQLFDALAQFNFVYPALKNDLALLPALKPGTANPLALNAMNIFQQLVSAVANAWYALANPPTDESALANLRTQSLIEQTFNFSLETLITPEGNLDSLTVKAFADQPVLLPSVVYVYTKDANNQPVKYKMLNTRSGVKAAQVAGASATEETFYYPDGSDGNQPVPAFGSVVQEFDFSDMDIVLKQNGWGGVYVTRNENLVSSAPTNPAFIYQTPLARFSNIMVPLIENTSFIKINDASNDLKISLTQLFADLFSSATSGTHYIKFGCQYGYQLVSSSSGSNLPGSLASLISRLPVLFIPKYAFSVGDTNLVTQVVDYITEWKQTSQASDDGGFFIFQVGLFSTLDEQLTQPLLEIENLVFVPTSN